MLMAFVAPNASIRTYFLAAVQTSQVAVEDVPRSTQPLPKKQPHKPGSPLSQAASLESSRPTQDKLKPTGDGHLIDDDGQPVNGASRPAAPDFGGINSRRPVTSQVQLGSTSVAMDPFPQMQQLMLSQVQSPPPFFCPSSLLSLNRGWKAKKDSGGMAQTAGEQLCECNACRTVWDASIRLGSLRLSRRRGQSTAPSSRALSTTTVKRESSSNCRLRPCALLGLFTQP